MPIRRKLFHLFLNKPDFKFSSGHFIAYKVGCLLALPFSGIPRATPWSQLSRHCSECFSSTSLDCHEGTVESRWIRDGLWRRQTRFSILLTSLLVCACRVQEAEPEVPPSYEERCSDRGLLRCALSVDHGERRKHGNCYRRQLLLLVPLLMLSHG